jgi:hypothetical protein
VTRRSTIGFDRRLDLEWLDAAAAQAAAGSTPAEFRDHLWNLLDGVVAGDRANSARGKTVTVLSHVWGDVPSSAVDLKERAIRRLGIATPEERLALHWSMMIGTYPVFSDAAGAMGRLLTLQGSFSLAQLTRRLVSIWGERSTLIRAARRIVRSMVQWGVLRDRPNPGEYERCAKQFAIAPFSAELLVEALLIDADEGAIGLDQLAKHQALFPFRFAVDANQLRAAGQFQIHRQGLDHDVVEIVGRSDRAPALK